MSAKIVTVSPGLIWAPPEVERLWFFPDGSQYLRYSPHFHMIAKGGFRQNFPLTTCFVVVLEGKLSVKDFYGKTFQKITVEDQVWFKRGTQIKAKGHYSWLPRTNIGLFPLRGRARYIDMAG